MKQRNTMQRQIVLETVYRLDTHPTVEDVYREVQKIHPAISKSTIYRNLHLLAESGDILRVSIPGDQERYDRNTKMHYHFLCRLCETISDVDIDIGCLDGIDRSMQKKYGVEVDEHDVVLRGVCLKCRFISGEGP